MPYNPRDDYWKPRRLKDSGIDDYARRHSSEPIYRLYVCDRCRRAYGHPVSYCSDCPGRCIQVEGMTYAEFIARRPGYRFGEESWDERAATYRRLAEAEAIGIQFPLVATCWVYVQKHKERVGRAADGDLIYEALIPRLVRELDREVFQVRELPEPDHVEIRLYFPSYGTFRDWAWPDHPDMRRRRVARFRIDPYPEPESVDRHRYPTAGG
jgi:hypothetical protein